MTPMSDDRVAPGHAPLEDDRYRSAVVDLLGTMAYGELTAFSELAADAAAAPTMAERVAVARLAARELAHHDVLAARLVELGADPLEAMAPFVPVLDGYHARTRASAWPERLVKAYVGDGIRTDFYREISRLVDPSTAALVDEVAELQDERDEALVAAIRAAVDDAPAIEGRLALWGRRLLGEALSQAQQVAVEREALGSLLVGGAAGHGADLAELGRMITRMSENHAARMGRLRLAA